MGFYWPNMAATLFVPSAGTASARQNQEADANVYRFDLRPHHARLVSNNHNDADELELTFSYDEAGLDPRFMRSGELWFYLADGYAFDGFRPGFNNLRFVGIVKDVERTFDQSKGKMLKILAQDYTCLFLEMKNFPPSGVPLFSDTLQTAWQRICEHTGVVDFDTDPPSIASTTVNLIDKLVLLGDINPNKTLGDVVPARIAKLGKLQLDNAADAWAVWQTAVRSLGLISFIRGDRCLVTNATDFYTADDPPRFLFGENIVEWTEARRLGDVSQNNVCLRSYDPLSGRTLEALYPHPALAMKQKRLGAAPTKKAPKVSHSKPYDAYDLPFVISDEETLYNIARMVWEERTRQELSGRLKTVEMYTATARGTQNAFDLLSLAAGDQIQVEVDREALDAIQGMTNVGDRVVALTARGYSDETAIYIAENLNEINKLPSQFLVKTVTTEFEATGAEGGCSFSMEIDYVNRIDITANADFPIGAGVATAQATGSNQPPMDGQSTDFLGKPPPDLPLDPTVVRALKRKTG
jgi:hypothetical protein